MKILRTDNLSIASLYILCEAASLEKAIASYAAEHAGTAVDLDKNLETASIEFLTNTQKEKNKKR